MVTVWEATIGSDRCTLTLEVCRACTLGADKSTATLRVPLALLRADASYSLLGEQVAGLLLSKVETESSEILRIVGLYRRRIAVEELYALTRAIGAVAGEALVDARYPAARRASSLGGVHLTLYNASHPLVEGEYTALLEEAGLLDGGRLNIRRVRRSMRSLMGVLRERLSRVNLRAARLLAEAVSRAWGWVGPRECPRGDPVRAEALVSLPEGVYLEGDAVEALRMAGFNVGECRRPTPLSSSVICEARGHGRIAVKRYSTAAIKWLPASLASPRGARFQIRPVRRFENEYRMLRLLRSIVRTPRILAVIREGSGPVMAREYLEGVPVLDSESLEHWRRAGRVLARLHIWGYTLGDANPGNILAGEGEDSIIDAEQAGPYTPERGAWDIIVFTVYSLIFQRPKPLVEAALEEYFRSAGGRALEVWEALREEEAAGMLRIVALPLYREALNIVFTAGERAGLPGRGATG